MLSYQNELAVAHWTAKDYAGAYRDYKKHFVILNNWFLSFMPEEESSLIVYEFYKVCKQFYELGF